MARVLKVFACCLLLNCKPLVAQVLPPPLMPEQPQIAAQIVKSIESKDLEGYRNLLSKNVMVFEEGKLVSRNMDEWIKRFGPKLGANGVKFKIVAVYASTGRLLVIEYFNSMNSWGKGGSAHCCSSYDAVSYDVAGGKIITIRRLRGGAAMTGQLGG